MITETQGKLKDMILSIVQKKRDIKEHKKDIKQQEDKLKELEEEFMSLSLIEFNK